MVYSPVLGSRRETVNTCQFFIVQLHGIATIVITGPARFLTEQRVLRDTF